MRLRMRTHTGELEQPNQLYLKEVGSLNAGTPARLSMHAHVPPSKSWTSVSPRRGIRLFYSLTHVPCDVTNDVTK